jgi:hypothetical protein
MLAERVSSVDTSEVCSDYQVKGELRHHSTSRLISMDVRQGVKKREDLMGKSINY